MPSPSNLQLTPYVIRRLFCCIADKHKLINGCAFGDPYRYNAASDLKYPLLFVELPLQANATGASPEAHLTAMKVVWYIFDRTDEEDPDESLIRILDKTYHLAHEVIERIVQDIRKRLRVGWKIEHDWSLLSISDEANGVYWANNLTGWRVEVTFTAVNPVYGCDTGFECANIFECLCEPQYDRPFDPCGFPPCVTPVPPVVDGDGVTSGIGTPGTMNVENMEVPPIGDYPFGAVVTLYEADQITIVDQSTFVFPGVGFSVDTYPDLITTQYYISVTVGDCESDKVLVTHVVG
jgi:hypothetical protein